MEGPLSFYGSKWGRPAKYVCEPLFQDKPVEIFVCFTQINDQKLTLNIIICLIDYDKLALIDVST